MAETFSLFGLDIYAYGLCAAIGAALVLFGMWMVGRNQLPSGTTGVFGVMGMALGIVFARALYCAVNWNDFAYNYENPMLVFRFFDGGLSMVGLIAGLLLAAVLTAKWMKTRTGLVMDALAVPFGLMMWALRFGEQFTDLGVGAAVEEGFMTAHFPSLFLESRMGVMVEYRLNVWRYEVIMAIVIFVAALACYRVLKNHAGDTALVVFSLYGAGQILWESMRDDGHMLIIFLRVGQLAAFLLPVVCCGILSRRVQNKKLVWIAWLVVVLCVASVAVLEFSLDGRLTFGTPTLARDWSLMAIACAALFAMPCMLLRAARKQER